MLEGDTEREREKENQSRNYRPSIVRIEKRIICNQMNERTNEHKNHRQRNWEVFCSSSHNANNYTCLIQHMLHNQHLNTHPECKINWRPIVTRRHRSRCPYKMPGAKSTSTTSWCTVCEREWARHRERDQSIIRRSFSSVCNTAWNRTQNRNIKHGKIRKETKKNGALLHQHRECCV